MLKACGKKRKGTAEFLFSFLCILSKTLSIVEGRIFAVKIVLGRGERWFQPGFHPPLSHSADVWESIGIIGPDDFKPGFVKMH